MAVKLPPKLVLEVREAIYKRADEFGYAYRNRLENGRFMNSLITDPSIGGKLAEYMSRDTIRTYIKDGVLNRYTKEIIKKSLSDVSSVGIVKKVYDEESVEISSRRPITICANKERIFIISSGTVAKWETALRKAIGFIPNVISPTINKTGSFVPRTPIRQEKARFHIISFQFFKFTYII